MFLAQVLSVAVTKCPPNLVPLLTPAVNFTEHGDHQERSKDRSPTNCPRGSVSDWARVGRRRVTNSWVNEGADGHSRLPALEPVGRDGRDAREAGHFCYQLGRGLQPSTRLRNGRIVRLPCCRAGPCLHHQGAQVP